MQFKTKEVREQALSGRLCVSLRDLIGLIDRFAILCGVPDPNGITLTSVYRPDDTDSYHSKWQAVDVRTRDWPPDFRHAVKQMLINLRSYNEKTQHEFESDHLHIEYDDGSIRRNQ